MFGRGHEFRGKRVSPLQITMLIFLREGPRYGYEVLKVLKEHFDGVWVPQTGSIYPALKKLEASGLVSSEERDGTDYYSITKEGNELVVEVLAHSPRDLRLMTRYFDLLGRAAEDLNSEVSQISMFQKVFESGDEDEDADRKARRLRRARDRIAEHLAMIERELNEIEGKNQGDEKR
mgnify:CR=1 FL=1